MTQRKTSVTSEDFPAWCPSCGKRMFTLEIWSGHQSTECDGGPVVDDQPSLTDVARGPDAGDRNDAQEVFE